MATRQPSSSSQFFLLPPVIIECSFLAATTFFTYFFLPFFSNSLFLTSSFRAWTQQKNWICSLLSSNDWILLLCFGRFSCEISTGCLSAMSLSCRCQIVTSDHLLFSPREASCVLMNDDNSTSQSVILNFYLFHYSMQNVPRGEPWGCAAFNKVLEMVTSMSVTFVCHHQPAISMIMLQCKKVKMSWE